MCEESTITTAEELEYIEEDETADELNENNVKKRLEYWH